MNWELQLQKLVQTETEIDARNVWKTCTDYIPFNYRFEHTRSVVNTARYLQRHEGGNLRVIIAAAWLHDIAKRFDMKDEPGPHHGILSATRASEILRTLDFTSKEMEWVHEAIEHHVGLFADNVKRSLEADIIWDADKLTKVGAVSIGHAFSIAPAFGRVTTEGMIQRGVNWLQVIGKTVSAFKTETARKIGRDRMAFLTGFYDRLKSEYEMEDDYASGD
ncbi:MAG: HD domain-containing protein [Acidobacteria bacterium]|nr:HD domain-containing protein [Acidobacteriota bacterium]